MQHIDENMMNTQLRELKPFINDKGQLTSYPAKYKKKLMALWYLADKIDMDREYSDTGRRKTTILSKLLCNGLYKV